MTTNNLINQLTQAGMDMVHADLTCIVRALDGIAHDDQRDQAPVMERCLRILPSDLYSELQAYLGTIRDAHDRLAEVLYGSPYLLALDGLVTDSSASAHALMSDDEAAALIEPISPTDGGISFKACLTHGGDDGCNIIGCAWYNPNRSDECDPNGIGWVTTRDDAINRYFAQLDRGVITLTEFNALVTNYWHERDMDDASPIERVQWAYDHDLLDAAQFHDAIVECWTEHTLEADDHPVTNCAMCSCESADEYRNAYLTARYPQMTGAPAVTEERTPG